MVVGNAGDSAVLKQLPASGVLATSGESGVENATV